MKQIKKPISAEPSRRIVLSEQSIGLTSVPNARELGGYINSEGLRIKRGKLIRSGQLCDITKADAELLVRKYDPGMIIDLRSLREAADMPDPKLGGVRYYNFPMTDDIWEKDKETLSTGGETEIYYSLMHGLTAMNAYRHFFERLLTVADSKAVLFHSIHGKDRAGVAAALLMTLLDIPEETVFEDFLLSNKANAHTQQTGEEASSGSPVPDAPLLNEIVHAHSLVYAFAGVSVEYGSVKDYIKKTAGLSDNDIKELKRKYLE